MELFEIFPWAALIFAALFGLLVGSFLNVVAYRVPIMMERAWREQCEELASEAGVEPPHEGDAFNLWTPRSAFASCSALRRSPTLGFCRW